ncbi:MAG: hypothetical protein KAR20_15585, partial [Candidatus Heimdallarchaeota archaeon]|nr:hypothetical protein [Candidatus Heimdallarchaeota archaeon]
MIGLGLLGLLFYAFFDDISQSIVLYLFVSLCLIIIIGWLSSFSYSKSKKSESYKVLGIGFAFMAYMFMISIFWTPNPNIEGPFQINESFCLGLIMMIFISPLSMSAFWFGVIGDCVLEYRKRKYFLLGLMPIILGYGSLLLASQFSEQTMSIFLSPILLGVYCIIASLVLFREKNKFKDDGIIYYNRSSDQKERELLDKLDTQG